MVILVTGGAGFVGSFVVDQLVARGHEVRVLDLLHPAAHHRRPDYLNPRAQYLWGDVTNPTVATEAVDSVDAVCHQAAMVGLGGNFSDIADYVRHNDLGTAILLRALHERRFAGRLVLASSMAVYGDGAYRCPNHGPVRPAPRRKLDLEAHRWEPRCPTCTATLRALPITEEAAAYPQNFYAATKLHQEHLCFTWATEHETSVVALRYHNVYGPRMPRDTPYAGVASLFRSALEAGRAPQVFEDGGQRRDFVHVHDVATANLLALEAPRNVQGAFNISSGEPHAVLDVAQALCEALPDAAVQPIVVPQFRMGDVRHVFGAPTRASERLRYRASVPFLAGMAEFATAALREPVTNE